MRLTPLICTFICVFVSIGLSNHAYAQQFARKTINPGDQLTVTVFGHPDLSIDTKVDLSGGFSIPVLGRIETSGKTIMEVHQVVNEKLKDYLTNAEAIVFFSGYSNFTMVNVAGEVQNPGTVFFDEGEWPNVLAAISHAGGSVNANPTVKVSRNNRTIFEGSLRSIRDGSRSRITIQSNDLILVH